MNQPPSFQNDIRKLFTDDDVACMKIQGSFDLHSYDDVKTYHMRILDRVSRKDKEKGRMPPYPRPHWTPAMIQLFREWIDGGMQP